MEHIRYIKRIQDKMECYGETLMSGYSNNMNSYVQTVLLGCDACEAMRDYIAHLREDNCETNLFLDECMNSIEKIRSYIISGEEALVSYEMLIEYAQALDCFLFGAKKEYIDNNTNIPIDVREKFTARFFSLEDEIRKHYVAHMGRTSDEKITVVYQNYMDAENSISKEQIHDTLQKVAKYVEEQKLRDEEQKAREEEQKVQMEELSIKMDEISETTTRIETVVLEIESQIKELSDELKGLQAFVEKQVELAISEDEIDRIIQTYTEQSTNIIVSKIDAVAEDREVKKETRKLEASIGTKGWNKLSKNSKNFLITAKVMYNNLLVLDDVIDYSGVCILVTKALEVEMEKRFRKDFLQYLDEHYKKDYSQYPTTLLVRTKNSTDNEAVVYKPMEPEQFTMGNIAYVLCYRNVLQESREQSKKNKACLIRYAKDRILSRYSETEIEKRLADYAKKIEEIRKRYRNPSAHANAIKKTDAEQCFDLVLDVEKLLKKMLDSFDI